jgi:hypothetical protein
MPFLEFKEHLDQAVLAGSHPAPEIRALRKQDDISFFLQQGKELAERRQGGPGIPAVHRHAPQGPEKFPLQGGDEKLGFGDIVKRGRQGQGHGQDVLPALVLGADNRGAGRRQMLKPLYLYGVKPGPGVAQQPSANTVYGGR